MLTKLYVGNLSYEMTESELQALFEKHGAIKSVTIIKDSFTGKSKGFGFVEMENAQDAEKALAENGNEFAGRRITVAEAKPKSSQNRGSGGGRSSGRGQRDGGRNWR